MTGPNDDPTSALRAKLAATLGEGRQSAWLPAFAEVPRHVFVPSFYQQDGQGQWQEVSAGDRGYVETVYSNTALTTQLDEQGIPTSSSSEPGLMLDMLDALGVVPGDRVYELGTGTGYNSALLASRLGDTQVVTMDVDPILVRLARERLAQTRYDPSVFAGDGAAGYPTRAPYDAIIATARLRRIPPPLLAQAREGGVIVAPVGFGVVRVTKMGEGEAVGQFLPNTAFFMPRRTPGSAPDFAGLEVQAPRETTVSAEDALGRLRFPLSLVLPGHSSCSWRDAEGNLTGVGLWDEDGSTASVHVTGKVRQIGPQRLWDVVEELAAAFPEGTPAREEFGLSVTLDGQRVWFRDADGPSWTLPS